MVAAGLRTAYKGREPMSPATSEPTDPSPNAAPKQAAVDEPKTPTSQPASDEPTAAAPVVSATAPSPPVAQAPPAKAPAPQAQPRATTPKKARRRNARVVVRKIGPWSVFKLSVIFYTCVMLVMLGAGVILYGMLGAIGALDSVERLIQDLFADRTFAVNGRWLFTRGLGIGIVMVVAWSLINVFIVFLYNLISDLVGGVEVTLAERR